MYPCRLTRQCPLCRCLPNRECRKRGRRLLILARFPPHLVRIVRQQNIARCQISSVLVEDVYWEPPAQNLEASHFCPSAVAGKQNVGASIEWWGCIKLSAPPAFGANVLEALVQDVRHHAQRIGKVAVCNLIFEIADGNGAKVIAHDCCFAPMSRNRAGC